MRNLGAEPSAALLISTSGAETDRIGEAVLADGGTAADAALAVAVAQPALCAGCWNSYAGILSFLYFDAQTGEVSSLNAGFNTPRSESISWRARLVDAPNERLLVPGFFAGVDQAHQRFGKLPLARLIQPSIRIAEDGFRVAAPFAAVMRSRRGVLLRSSEGRRTFQQPDGSTPRAGALLRQPALAHTLREVAGQGAAYMYRGAWARRFVETVRRGGASLDLDDLAGYSATWTPPLHTTLNGADVFTVGLPGVGGMFLIEALNLLRVSELDGACDFDDAEFLFWLIQVSRARYLGPGLSAPARLGLEAANELWQDMLQRGRWNFYDLLKHVSDARHSDAVVVRDNGGNVAALCHSIATVQWGRLGVFVDGVSISDATAHYRPAIAQLGPAGRVPDAMNPTIVLRAGRPQFASACIGQSLHEVTLQYLLRAVIVSQEIDNFPELPDFLCPQWDGVYRLATLRGPIGETFGDLVFGLLMLAVRPFPSLARRVLDIDAVIPGRPRTATLVDALALRGERAMVLARDPLPSTWVGLQMHDARTVGGLRSTASHSTSLLLK